MFENCSRKRAIFKAVRELLSSTGWCFHATFWNAEYVKSVHLARRSAVLMVFCCCCMCLTKPINIVGPTCWSDTVVERKL